MLFDDLLGNETAKKRLDAVVAGGRVAGTWLFAGPAGVGKRTLAERFLSRLEAEITTLSRLEDKRDIAVEQVRELLRALSFKASGTRPRGVIVDEAERLNAEGQNALLKTLEEPPERCLFVLVSASPALLLPTIVSRCHTVLFSPLTAEEMVQAMRPLKLDPATASWIAALAGGSPGRARELAADAQALRERAADLFSHLATGELNPVIEHLSKVRDPGDSRDRGREILHLVVMALREGLRARATGAAADPALLPDGLARRLAALDEEDFADRIRLALDRLRAIDANANVTLAVEDALLRVTP